MLDLILNLVSVNLGYLTFYIPAFGFAPFYLLKYLKISGDYNRVILKGYDPVLMSATGLGFGLVVSTPIVFGFPSVGVFNLLVCCLLWLGFRVRISIFPGHTIVERRFLFLIPWQKRSLKGVPELISSHFGHFSDPDELHLKLGDTELELGWTSKEGFGEKICENYKYHLENLVV